MTVAAGTGSCSGVLCVELALLVAACLATLTGSGTWVSLVCTSSLSLCFGFALGRGRSRATLVPLGILWLLGVKFGALNAPFALLIPGVLVLALLIPIVRLVCPMDESRYNTVLAAVIGLAGISARYTMGSSPTSYYSLINICFTLPVSISADAAFAGWLLARPPRLDIRQVFAIHLAAGTTLLTIGAAYLISHSPLKEVDGLLLPLVAVALVIANTVELNMGDATIRILYSALIIAGPIKYMTDSRICQSDSKTQLSRLLCHCVGGDTCTSTTFANILLLTFAILFGALFFFSVDITLERVLTQRWPKVMEHWPNMQHEYEEGSGVPKRENGWTERVIRVILYYTIMVLFFWAFLRFSVPASQRLGQPIRNPVLCLLPKSLYSCSVTGRESLQTWTESLSFKIFLNACRVISLLSLPTFILNFIGHIAFPRANWNRMPSVDTMLKRAEKKPPQQEEQPALSLVAQQPLLPLDLDFVLYFRYVTRGMNAELTIENCERAAAILRSTGLPESSWRVEVITDNALGIAEALGEKHVYEIVVPTTYKPPNGALYKARALNYAIENSPARDYDWIIHLDEETRFDVDTVHAILLHCGKQTHAVRVSKKLEWPSIGQGLIVYGRAMLPTLASTQTDPTRSWTTSLADSARVADDCGRFRMQYECGEVWLGMHGSFVVCANVVEKTVTYDHGIAGSIAEDAYFALKARSLGVRFAWVDALMFEQSPFSFTDFMRQRARWLVGGLLVVHNKGLPLGVRYVMGALSTLWAAMPLTYLAVTLAILLGSLEEQQSTSHAAYQFLLPASVGLSVWSYIFGYFVTFAGQGLGWVRFVAMGYLQLTLMPLFGIMELCGVLYGLVNFRKMSHTFHVVQKTTSTKRNTDQVTENTPLVSKE